MTATVSYSSIPRRRSFATASPTFPVKTTTMLIAPESRIVSYEEHYIANNSGSLKMDAF